MEDELWQNVDAFARWPSIGTAAELVSTGILSGQTDLASDAAAFILAHRDEAPGTLVNLAGSVTGESSIRSPNQKKASEEVALTRKLLRINPDNPVLWSDMARHFASNGDKKQASRCMKSALALAPNHRWMLRTVARFLVHQDEPLAAHQLLAKHPRTRNDPWLIAAELACAHVAGRAPKFWKTALEFVRRDAVSPVHLSELATAAGMMELEAGNRKTARRLVLKGLIDPTENALAQVFWAQESHHLSDGFKLEELVKSANDAYEADYKVAILGGDIISALRSAETWQIDEPFASRPCEEIAYIASLMDDHDMTIRMARQVKHMDGHSDPSLELNAFFARMSSGTLDIKRDQVEINRIRMNLGRAIRNADGNSFHAVANLGLWEYRFGDMSAGRTLYQQAVTIAQKVHYPEAAALAATFAAREAILGRDPTADLALKRAKELASSSKHLASEFYLRKLDEIVGHEERAGEILSPSSTERFVRVKKVDARPFRVEKKNDRLVLWVPRH
ncbi:MAG: hypothetical protein IPJ48_01645 [Propionivibrio sp.]|uniref:Tetratricopeptide repeat protein n=1 Tax=Candidatus Propionivibrio dominans TaxID=2954373 RepID=A0A9D7FCM8_9RHOO|nr:hypothetical protein [Candidatus Propionivibrio dominans]